jgi:hypothetical protein
MTETNSRMTRLHVAIKRNVRKAIMRKVNSPNRREIPKPMRTKRRAKKTAEKMESL